MEINKINKLNYSVNDNVLVKLNIPNNVTFNKEIEKTKCLIIHLCHVCKVKKIIMILVKEYFCILKVIHKKSLVIVEKKLKGISKVTENNHIVLMLIKYFI